jgi:stage IV sporulation protein B
MRKYWYRRILILIFIFTVAAGGIYYGPQLWNANRNQEVSVDHFGEDTVLLGGMPVGIYMETKGVMVLDTETVDALDGGSYAPAENLVKPGDYIIEMNGLPVENKEQLIKGLRDLNEQEVILTLERESEQISVRLHPVCVSQNEYKLGIWVRDNIQGLGTITFLTQNSKFGALGHGIHDVDTNALLSISDGRLYETSIRSVMKGLNGKPGSMEGIIVYNNYNKLGSIQENAETGIYGTLDKIERVFTEQIPIKIGTKESVEVGPAQIRCCIDNEIHLYDIEILEIDMSQKEINKGLVIRVTDPELLDKTGGIIQGMSGSPILQNGKLVGAVTHVFVNDPTKGYGIFIETMLKKVEN